MADRASAKITVGGRMTPEILTTFVEVAQGERLSVGWDGELVEESDIEAAAQAGESITLGAHEVSGAQFDELEAFCFEHRLPFVRESDGYAGSWSPERVTYRGDEAEPRSWETDDDGDLVLTQQALEKLGSYEAALAYFEEGDFIVPGIELADAAEPVAEEA